MDFETTRKLRNAGYPFIEMAKHAVGDTTYCHLCGRFYIRIGEQTFLEPTLDQLIEACGNEITEMYRAHKEPDGQVWVAKCCDKEAHKGVGKTLLIAVARLWLSLNKHV